jgi:hypothetical protein
MVQIWYRWVQMVADGAGADGAGADGAGADGVDDGADMAAIWVQMVLEMVQMVQVDSADGVH